MKVIKFKCLRCNHSWIPRDEKYLTGKRKPTICPKCKSPYWNIKKTKFFVRGKTNENKQRQ